MKYEFVIMYLGNEINRYSCDNYNRAQICFYHEYYKDDQACLVFINGEEMNIFDAYEYFNIKELSVRYGLIPANRKENYNGN